MFKTILWATDGSETAALALPYALGLAEPDKAKVVVVHIREIFVGRAGGYPVIADEDDLREQIEQQVKDLQAVGRTRPSSSARVQVVMPPGRSRGSRRRSRQT